MPENVPQRAFTGGEIAPSIHARVDLRKYDSAAKTLRNVIVHAHGGASNRAGFRFVVETKDSSKTTRLIQFAFSTTQTYVLEFGDLSMRVIKEDGIVLSGGSPYVLTTPYAHTELAELKFVQSADTLYLAHPNHAPRKLTRTAHDNWTLTIITFAPSIAAPTGVTVTPNLSGSETFWYAVTAVAEETAEESLAGEGSTTTSAASGWDNTISWTAVSGAESYNIYRKKNGIYGFVGRAEGTSFDDKNIDPDAGDTPPKARNPFTGAGDYPGAVGLHDQRSIWGATDNDPQKSWLSQAANYENLNVSTPSKDDDAVTFTIAARQVNKIEHYVSMTDLLILTSGGEWKVNGGQDAAISPSNVNVKPQSFRGSSSPPPLVIGETVLFVQRLGNVVRDLAYSLEADGYTGNDLSVLASHLLEGRKITEWAYAEVPHSIIWCVRDDGKLISMTYLREHEVWAWHQHDTDGVFESVAVIPEGNEDVLYAVVKRTINGSTKRYVERMASRQFTDVRDAFFVDSGLSLDNPKTISGATQTDPVVVTATGHGFSNGDLIDIADVEGMTEINNKRFKAANVTANTFELTDQYDGTGIDGTGYAGYVSGGAARKAVTSVSGADHLEGCTVAVLGDGNVQTQKTVSSGAITLDEPASRVHIGIPYTSDIETMPVHFEGTSGRKMRIGRVTLQVLRSRGLWIGPDADHLTELKRQVANYDDPTVLLTEDLDVTQYSKWDSRAGLFLRQADPLPLTVLAVIPRVNVGG